MDAIVVNNVSKSYGKVQALSDVSFAVSKGEVFGLIGPDGAGKTSMFRILCTLLLPEGGRATVDGYDVVAQMREVRRRVGYMPGKFSLYQDLTVEENLKFFATLFGTTVDEGYDSIKAIYSQIERFRNRRAGALSGGMKQKLALSCALVHQPSVLFLDEPTTGVDPVSRKELWEMLLMLKERGITIVASTPYLDEVRCCERVAFLDHGRVRGIDTPEAILEQFKEIFNPGRPTPSPSLEGKGADTPTAEPAPQGNYSPPFEGGAGGRSPIIEVEHLVMKRGEIFGFLGANGAGKTTAMHMLTGLSQPTSGKGSVAGYDIRTEQEQIKRHIGYMSQKFSLYEDLTVSENIRLFAGIYGMNSEEIRVKREELLRRLKFEEHKDDLVGSLPLGWKQKLAFSVSIFHEPAHRGITVFVTTHYMDEAEYCDRISIMVDGKIKAIGTPEALKQAYNQPDMDHVFTYLARQAKRGEG